MNLTNELRMLAEDLYVNGYNRYSSAMSQAADEIECLRAKITEMEKQEPIGTALLCTRCSTPFDGDHYCPACGHHTATEEAVYAIPGAQPAPSVPDGWKEAAIAWEVCASIHREYGKGKDPFFNTRQGDFVKHANDARAMLAGAPEAKP